MASPAMPVGAVPSTLGPSVPLRVYAPPGIRPAVIKAIHLWNVAAGEEWLQMTDDPNQARIVYTPKGSLSYPGRSPDTISADAEVGGRESEGGGKLHVYFVPALIQKLSPSDRVYVFTHEMGHNMGLLDAYSYGPGQSPQAPDRKGLMGIWDGDIIPWEVNQIRYELGLSSTPADTALPMYPNNNVTSVPGRVAATHWIDDFESRFINQDLPEQGLELFSKPVATLAAGLVTAGIRARADAGATTPNYDYHQYVKDVDTMAKAFAPEQVKPTKQKQGVGGGQSNQKKE